MNRTAFVVVRLLVADRVDILGEVEHLVGEAPLVVVPGDELDKVGVQADAGVRVEDGGVGIGAEVGGDDLLVGVSQDTGHRALGGLLDGGADLIIAGALLEAAGQVDDGDIGAGDTHGHAGQLALQLGDDLADSLGGAGGGGDDVLEAAAAQAPVLLGEGVNDVLGGGAGVDGGHEALDDAELVVDDLGERSQAVGGAGGVGDDGHAGVILVEVDAADEHRGVVLGGAGENNDLGAGIQMRLSGFLGEELAGALEDVINAQLAPGELRGVAAVEELDVLAVHDEVAVDDLDGAVEAAVDGVILRSVSELLGSLVGGVHGDDLDVVTDDAGAEDQTADAAEAIDAYSDAHLIFLHI